ncbi:MAG: DNA primase [Clostridia bacterium]
MRLSDAWLDDLRSRVNIVDVVSEYVLLKQKGRRYWGLCPFHNEKTASFSVDADAQMYYCFGCHKGGNVIHFVMELEKMEFMDAVKHLADRVNLEMPSGGDGADSSGARALREKVYAANVAAARYFHEMLWTSAGANALSYLHKRGLDDMDIRRFGLGAASPDWDDMTTSLAASGIDEDVLVAAGLTVRKESRRFDMFRDRAIFPIINAQGRVLGFGGRAMGEVQPKYLNTSDSPVFNKRQGLYAMNFVKNERGLKRLVLVEGYMDVVSLRRAGVPGVVATLGTALTDEQTRLLKRYAPEVWIGYDGDAAGQKAIERALELCEAQSLKARVLVFPDGQDPDDFIRLSGASGFEKLKPIEPIAYRMQRAAAGLDLSKQEVRAQYAITCCAFLRKVKNPVELQMYVERLSIETGFGSDVLLKQVGVSEEALGAPEKARTKRAPEVGEDELQRAQRTLIALLGSRLIASETVKPQDFDDELYRRMAQELIQGRSPAAVLDEVPEEMRERAARALSEEVMPDEQKALMVAEDCLSSIRKLRAAREVEGLKQAYKTAAPDEKRALLARMGELLPR